MNQEDWPRIRVLFEQALACEPTERVRFIEGSCRGDEALKSEILSLLHAHGEADSFLRATLITPMAPVRAEPPSLIGTSLRNYRIELEIGRGGMGVVYRARDTHLNRLAAIKVLTRDGAADPERRMRLLEEARAASALDHPNIVTIFAADRVQGIDFVAMEYVDGETLAAMLRKRRPAPGEAFEVAVQIIDALAAAHAAGIIHRDIKPANIMVKVSGVVKVLDFGLVKRISIPENLTTSAVAEPLTKDGAILGTFRYMSPEQRAGQAADARSDVFSLGLVFEELFPKAVLPGGGLPPELPKIIERCLRADPRLRFRDAGELKEALLPISKLVRPHGRVRQTRRMAWGGAVLLAAVLACGWLWFPRPGAPQSETFTVLPLTPYPGFAHSPTFSPDGKQVAFSWNGVKQDNSDIYVKLIGSDPPLRLTTDPASDFSPAWSPDGRSIAFRRSLPDGKSGVFLIPAIGGPEQRVAETQAVGSMATVNSPELCWYPDGEWLVIAGKSAPGEPSSLFVLSPQTRAMRRLTFPPRKDFGDTAPAFSPDGRILAFARYTAFGISEIYLLPISKGVMPIGEPRRVTFESWHSTTPAWTADSREIVFFSNRGGPRRLWRMPVSGGAALPITSLGEEAYHPAISGVGHRLAFASIVTDIGIWQANLQRGMPSGGSSVSLMASNRVHDLYPDFSPDGSRIAFQSDRYGVSAIWLCGRDGTNPIQLTPSVPGTNTPQWSPDGTRVAFASRVEGTSAIFVINSEGGLSQRVTFGKTEDTFPSWSRDGRYLYFTSERGGATQIWKMPSGGGPPVQLTREGGIGALEAQDGSSIYYSKMGSDRGPGRSAGYTASLWNMPAAGGEEHRILESMDPQIRNFAVADQGIYFIGRRKGTAEDWVQFWGFDTGAVRPVLRLEHPPFGGLAVAPDGRSILYTQIDSLHDNIMLVENFR